jgi:hypothetical protein
MAVQALLAQYSLVSTIGWNAVAAVNSTWVARGCVALLAQPGLPGNQQIFVIGAMRRMAVGAILAYRRVFPQQRAAFLGMAVISGFIDGIAHQ